MSTKNEKQTIVISATSSIGRTLFKKYAAISNRISIVGRRTHLLDELRKEHPDTTVTAMADITKQRYGSKPAFIIQQTKMEHIYRRFLSLLLQA